MTTIIGCDFTSRPTRVKPITVSVASYDALTNDSALRVSAVHSVDSLEKFEDFLSLDSSNLSKPWVGGFDLPFGLPRELVEHLNWPNTWLACMKYYCSLERSQIREVFQAFCASRAVGSKFAHRATDLIAKSSPSMKWINPPVAYMLHAGMPVLINAKVSLPGLLRGDPSKVGLEAYPGKLAKEIVGNQSYKSDDKRKQNLDRLLVREKILNVLVAGKHSLGIKLKIPKSMIEKLLEDASGDNLDAVLCAVQAAWGVRQYHLGDPLYGMPSQMDELEGWILTC